MEDGRTHLEVATSDNAKELFCGKDSCSFAKPQEVGNLSMPICFLVKEQAKSLVAVQDLQKRIESIENIQDDVADSLAEIKKFLCLDSRTYNCLEFENSPNVSNGTPFSYPVKLGSFSKYTYLPNNVKEIKTGFIKEHIPVKLSTEKSQKQFELKNKEFALESDKQDSGLDSDHVSLNRHSVNNWVSRESGDELLQLLDEISDRTEILQKQLAVIDQNNDSKGEETTISSTPCINKVKATVEDKDEEACMNCFNCSKGLLSSVTGMYMEKGFAKSSEESRNVIQSKSQSEHVHKIQNRATNKIDSAIVSSILKETNVVDLQRQVLIYLVENAVLHTKLGELDKLLTVKTAESAKIESSLKDETRLLMMENRELRISLDEQKLETNSLRSKVLMLEKVLQSISVENRELTWQLGESLGIENLSRKEPHKSPPSYTFNNSTNSRFLKRLSLPSQFVCHNETNVNCVKSKLLSNVNNFLDITVEDPEPQLSAIQTPASSFKKHGMPVQSSTPVTPFTKVKDVKTGGINSSLSSPNFQSVKKRFKATGKDGALFKHSELDNCQPIPHSEMCDLRNIKFNSSNADDTMAKFPFNSILDKLKANSDNRILRRTSLSTTNEINFSNDLTKHLPNKSNPITSDGDESTASSENLRQNSHAKNLQSKKGKNIHQRIQNILDRIMAESEEAS